jgi:hypothetical protein
MRVADIGNYLRHFAAGGLPAAKSLYIEMNARKKRIITR